MVCPLCEHVQEQGASCDECGWQFAPQSVAAAAEEPCEGLEMTRLAPVADVPIVPLARLDRGREEAQPGSPQPPQSIYLSDEEEVMFRCPNCGLLGRSGQRCVACGVPVVTTPS